MSARPVVLRLNRLRQGHDLLLAHSSIFFPGLRERSELTSHHQNPTSRLER